MLVWHFSPSADVNTAQRRWMKSTSRPLSMAESVSVIDKCIYRIILSPQGKPCNDMVA
ncbi:hypothetical protein BN2476_360051 [Paraburkholderia piptadeniae]|uniref:Uncharacterized protein n=1 Tax=Paraburkholderia piptadeniae TaxID=1701573 RepID=A0A1N7S990_9BURK|nr:hypothetical protein BN2476_360051 [Paraburkholderia piptadeniae]